MRDVGFDDAPMVDDDRVGDDGIHGASRARNLALAHAVADDLAAAEFHLFAVGGEVLLDLDEEFRVGEPDAVARRGAEHVGVGGAGERGRLALRGHGSLGLDDGRERSLNSSASLVERRRGRATSGSIDFGEEIIGESRAFPPLKARSACSPLRDARPRDRLPLTCAIGFAISASRVSFHRLSVQTNSAKTTRLTKQPPAPSPRRNGARARIAQDRPQRKAAKRHWCPVRSCAALRTHAQSCSTIASPTASSIRRRGRPPVANRGSFALGDIDDARRFRGAMTILPSTSRTKWTLSPGAKSSACRIALGRVICPLLVDRRRPNVVDHWRSHRHRNSPFLTSTM